MRRIFALTLAALIVIMLIIVPQANAESSTLETDFNATVAVTLANPGQFFSDAEGNRYYQGLVYTGQLSGWPVTGTLRIDANVAFNAGSSTGQLDGSYVISDNSGNSFHGDLAETQVQETPNGLLVSARLNIEGGTGLFDGARGRARVAGILPMLGVTAAAFGQPAFGQPAFGQAPFGQPYANGLYPPAQPAFGAYPSAVNPFPINPAQPTLAISGTLALDQSPDLGFWWNQPQVHDHHFNFRNPDVQRQFREAIRDFFAVNNNDNVRRGNGWGDRNHEHIGSQGNDDRHENRNSRGRGRGHDKD